MLRQIGSLLCGLALAGCSYILGPTEPRPPDPAPQEMPAVKKIIGDNKAGLFDASANATNIVISTGIRRFDSALVSEYGACVRASMSNRAGKDMGVVTYVVTVAGSRIGDRRRATPADECDKEKYEPL